MKRYKDIFCGNTALVTGGAKRIGRDISLELARMGCNILVHYAQSSLEAQKTVEKAKGYGVQAFAFQADLSNPEEAEELLSKTFDKMGKVHYLINNASTFDQGTVADISWKNLQSSLAVNTFAPFVLTRNFAAQKIKSVVVNILDTRIFSYDKEHIAYHLSKRALYSVTRMMAYEYAPSLRVNGVAPGIILPPAGHGVEWLQKYKYTNPLESYGSVEDISDAVLFLLASDFITGEVICVDGGRHLKNNFYG